MDESRQASLPGTGAASPKAGLPPALCGYLLLLTLIFAVSYAVGAGSGPVAPGMRDTQTATSGDGQEGADVGGMGGMDGMHGGGR
jgi:hypothetical protein